MEPIEISTSHKQLRNVVAERLRTAIRDGLYRPDEWLRQERISQELGVSQMPVREALKELASEGLVEYVPYRGVRVREYTIQDVEDLYAHRCYLEGTAARAAAVRITPEEIEGLRSLQQQMAEHMSPDELPIYRELNRRFHQNVFAASQRNYLIRTLNQLWVAFPTMLWGNFYRTAFHTYPDRDASDIEEHELLIQALEAHDSDLAEKYVVEHIRSAERVLLQALQASEGT
jgi:DNA-binding GntR family transcriptional regulator